MRAGVGKHRAANAAAAKAVVRDDQSDGQAWSVEGRLVSKENQHLP